MAIAAKSDKYSNKIKIVSNVSYTSTTEVYIGCAKFRQTVKSVSGLCCTIIVQQHQTQFFCLISTLIQGCF